MSEKMLEQDAEMFMYDRKNLKILGKTSDTSRHMVTMSRMNQKFAVQHGGPDYVKHITSITSELWSLKSNEVLCDTEIVVQGKTIKCHKVVLASSSEFFRNMFKYNCQENSESQSKVVIDKDDDLGLNSEIVETVLFYMYCGILPYDLDDELIPDIFVLAHMWLLEDLQEICISCMIKDIGTKNFQQFLIFSERFQIQSLKDTAILYIRRNLPHILQTEEFTLLEEAVIHKAINDPIVVCHDNFVWVDALKNWSKGSDQLFESALDCVPVQYLSSEQMCSLLCDPRIETAPKFMEKLSELCGQIIDKKPTDIKYFPKKVFDIISMETSRFYMNDEFHPGVFVHYKDDEIVMEEVRIVLEPLKNIVNNTIKDFDAASQVLYKNEIYFMFDNRCNEKKHNDHWNQPIYRYSFVTRTWSKFDCPLSFIVPNVKVQCSCQIGGTMDFKKFLHLDNQILYYLIGTPEMKILLKTDLEKEKPEWKVVFSHASVEGPLMHEQIVDETGTAVSRPNWRDVEIIKIDEEKIHFMATEELERHFQLYTLSFTNQSVLSSRRISPRCNQLSLTLLEEEKLALFSTVKKTSQSSVTILDTKNMTEELIEEELNCEVVSIDTSGSCLFIIAKKKSKSESFPYFKDRKIRAYKYDLNTQEWDQIKCSNKKGKKVNEFELEDRLSYPGYSVPCQLLYNTKMSLSDSDGSDDDDIDREMMATSSSRIGLRVSRRFKKARKELKKVLSMKDNSFL